MSALWSLGVVEQLGHIGLGVAYYLQYTLVLVVFSGLLVLGMYHILIQRFKVDYFRRVTAVGYSCVVFGWMTILSVKQPSSKLDLFGFLSLPISFAPFESLIFTSIIVPQASFLGHLSGIIVGYATAWGLIHGMNNFWAISMLGWIVVIFVSLKRSGAYNFNFIDIESNAFDFMKSPSCRMHVVVDISGAEEPAIVSWLTDMERILNEMG
ncbi:hypothetical protein GH714_037119 [Hevea brasiliensis]|uniref:Peptidase S54 rhomboid domain-containing protein n=1 Tax=Hevea brasiliensis TaxID=3981 RepID=A0A6A6NF80_HEVBR|nr:hypothetical protein GH714_037119 [Hevea brasiliensis]